MSYVHVGKIHSPQGVRGQVFVSLFAGEAAWEDQWQELLMSPPGENEPSLKWPITKKRSHQKQKKWGFVLNLKEVHDRNQVEPWVGFKVYVPESFLESQEGEAIFLREVLGFEVVDQERGAVGVIQGFSGHQLQDLLVIEHPSGQSFEVPFVEPLLIEICKSQKQVRMDIPWGLVPGEEL